LPAASRAVTTIVVTPIGSLSGVVVVSVVLETMSDAEMPVR
jgi:hypothetical protein